MATYTFDTTRNGYFNGGDLRITEEATGRSILVNEKDGMCAVSVKDHTIRAQYPRAVDAAADKIGEHELGQIYEGVRSEYWDWAERCAEEYGFSVYGAGRMGGWLAASGTDYLDGLSLIEPAEEDIELRDKFLKFAFEVVGEIDDFRQQFYDAVKAAAAAPPRTQIMVLADGETFGPLAGCKIIEVEARCDTEEIEELLDAGTDLPVVRAFQ